ncbi:3-hydroxybutyryl-CoA epimerase [Pseudomonas putida]|uniref:3-hydroxyacyl-CoA dehydrogenase NAD-binding domain-containing protein n=1 Tax=Pseudomonas putida TaxID=303 RepID=UPI00159DBA7E|nr:3-hydroxyacyl-CoA dehydrogenase NAD-binding domain-containing protein [Pseudomonas putida]NVN64906.1 3-hydroxybutyryl-CoA epimerase [Pseudomonas putida]NVN69774.1 3-hydroxybutyryl-CoA epimerase [Pseudomonas putida]
MNSLVAYQREGDVGLIIINNPPVNALSREVRAQVLARFEQASSDAAIQAIVILCEGRTFIAGADIKEFDLPLQAPHLPDVLAAIERSPKPVIAAMHGSVLGGGLELALACHYRIAAPGTQFGLPEVSLGLIPGAGGTQRLPRLCGMQVAVDMVVGGEQISVEQALAVGLLDRLGRSFVFESALEFAKEIVGQPIPRSGEQSVAAFDPNVIQRRSQAILRKVAGQEAPPLALQALQAAWQVPFDEGMALERERFISRRQSAQARALRHVFFAERDLASRRRALAKQAPVRSVGSVAVIGAGTMGSGIALCLANAGIKTLLIDTQPPALDRGRATIERYYASALEKGHLSPEQAAERAGLIRYEGSLEQVVDADLIIEAVFEDLSVKQDVFRELDRFAKPGAILATNTSYLDVDAIAGVTDRPGDVIGMHFFSPAHIMKLLEVVKTAHLQPDVLATVLQLGGRLGKTAVAVGNCYGFVGNRLLAVREREATFLLEEGASPEDVDRVLRGFGFPIGPFELRDLAGVDIAWLNRKGRGAHLGQAERSCNLIEQLHEAGRLGQKTGAGYYRYEEGQRKGCPDPFVAKMLVEHRHARGLEPRVVSDDEILQRCLFVMINEAAHMLEQGIVDSPNDIDLVWIHGYGFPRYRGGLLYHADQVGLARISEALEQWSIEHPDRELHVCALLQARAKNGVSLSET